MIKYAYKKPSLKEFAQLREAVCWNLNKAGISLKRANDSLKQSPLCVCAHDNGTIVGMVRLSGDLSMYGYIQDTIVLPNYQGRGIGKNLMQHLIRRLKGRKGYLLGVCPSKVSVDFYEGFGFKKRPENPNGFMSLKI